MSQQEKAEIAAEYIKKKLTQVPCMAILTGTGLGEITDTIEISEEFDYETIPHFPVSTVTSHTGKLITGIIEDRQVIAMQGRFHLYEGYSAREVTFPIRVMQELGVRFLIITNAAGGLNLNYSSGDIMVISDHINLTGENPLAGPEEKKWGPRFPDMINAYDRELSDLAESAAAKHKIKIRKGVYAGLKGPSLETPAEMRFLKIIGADAVGFSTVPEVIAGQHAGMKILGLSIITNINNPEMPVPATVHGVIQTARETVPGLVKIINSVIAELPISDL